MQVTDFGPYRLVELLDAATPGETWRAVETATGRELAVTLLPLEWADDPKFARRFRHESRVVAGLKNPHVLPVYDYGDRDGRLFLARKLVAGRDLRTVLADGSLDPQRAGDVVGQVADALDAAHAEGLVHRDIRPATIVLDESDGNAGFAYVTDFGLARTTDPIVPADAGDVDVWANLAPEQLDGAAGDARSDVYSLACVLYECLTGRAPFPDVAPDELRTLLAAPPPAPSTLGDGVPADVDDVVARGMATLPGDRYPGAIEFARAARAALAGESPPVHVGAAVAAAEQPTRRRRRRWSNRKLTIAVLASVGIVAMVATTAAAIVMPFLLRTDDVATPRTSTLPTSTAPLVYIAPLSVRPVGRALVPQPGQCDPAAPPPPPAPPEAPFNTCDVERKAFYEMGPQGITLTLTSANAVKLPMSDVHAVQLVMDEPSSERFAQYTGTQIGKQVAFVRDGLVLAAPAIGQPISGTSIQLSGELTAETAETIARMLREGR